MKTGIFILVGILVWIMFSWALIDLMRDSEWPLWAKRVCIAFGPISYAILIVGFACSLIYKFVTRIADDFKDVFKGNLK